MKYGESFREKKKLMSLPSSIVSLTLRPPPAQHSTPNDFCFPLCESQSLEASKQKLGVFN